MKKIYDEFLENWKKLTEEFEASKDDPILVELEFSDGSKQTISYPGPEELKTLEKAKKIFSELFEDLII